MSDLTIRADPNLTQPERETIVKFDADPDRDGMIVHSEHPAVIRWLLAHPDYEQSAKRVREGDQYATTGTLPIGALKLSGRRKSQTPGSILGQIPDGG